MCTVRLRRVNDICWISDKNAVLRRLLGRACTGTRSITAQLLSIVVESQLDPCGLNNDTEKRSLFPGGFYGGYELEYLVLIFEDTPKCK